MEEEDFSKLSIEERCAHKSWKARVSGYEDVAKIFRTIDDEKSPEWNKYHGMVKKFVVDSNVPAQEKGLDAVLLFVGNCGTAGKTVNDVVSGLVQKCITSPKAKIKELANQICLMYIEIEKYDIVLEELLKGTEVKNPKIQAASVHLITEALREFGPKVINPNKLIKRAIALLEDRDKTVRQEAKQLLIEIYRWLGPALASQLSSLKTAQLTEMNAAFEQLDQAEGRAVPTRLLRSQQAKQAQVARNEEDGGDEFDDGGGAEGEEINPLDLLEPVDILSQLPQNFYKQLESKAWVERKEALEPLEKSLNEAPKIENADYSTLMKALKKIVLKDSNIVVVCFAIRCISGIAKGLKKKFQQYAAVTLQALIEKFKEKKPNVVAALRDAADNVYVSVKAEAVAKLQAIVSASPNITSNLGEVPTLIAARINDSNTKIAASAIVLVESLAKAMGPAGKQHVKVFLPPLLKFIGDPKVWIRTPAISCVNTLGDACGYREFFENEIIADALKSGSPSTRAELWTWLAEKLPNIPVKTISKDELLACLPTLYNNLEDRAADVRKAANDAVLGFMIHLGFNSMTSAREKILKPGSAPVARAGARKKDEDVETGLMLKVNSLKNQRSIDDQKSKTIKWNFTTPRAEYVDLLRDQMTTAGFNKNLIANMFHVDFKYHLKAIDSLFEELPINLPGLLSNLDLVLRWMTLRFCDTNPSVISRGLEYLANAFNALQNEGYTMLEFEASAFIPYLIQKSGDPKDVIQAKVKELFEQLKLIYPVGKLVMYLIDGAKSKNARQRAACLDVLNVYMDQYGGSVCQPSLNAVVKDIVKHFVDRDSTVRQSVFRVAVSLYSHEGERFFHILNQFAEKDGQLLEERIRKSAKNRPVASVKPMSIKSEEPEEPAEPEEEYQEEDHHERTPPYHSSPSVNSTPPQSNATINVKSPSMIDRHVSAYSPRAAIKPIQMPRMTPTLSNFTQPTAIKYEINQIASTDIEKAMQSMTQIDTVLNSDKVCSDPGLCSAIDEQFLQKVLDQVLSLLAESKQETIDRQEMFKRVLNNIVLKLLENANKTSLICALITMLGESMGKPSNVGHYHDLCIRCLWKLIRAQPKWDRELNYNRLLLVYQKFLKDYPSSWWRTQEVDVPLRTVKTMLHTMVKLRGTEVRDIINNDDQLSVETELSLYVKKLVRHLKMEENKDCNKSHGESVDRSKTDKPASSVSHRMIKEQTSELSEIFKLIGDPNETDEGLKKLYAFKNAHPEADIQPFLVKASSVFQDYIKRGLQDLEAQNNQNANRQLHSNTFNFSGRADDVSNESCVSSENKYTAEAERLRNRLSLLQEKAGCNESKQTEKADVPRDNKHIKVCSELFMLLGFGSVLLKKPTILVHFCLTPTASTQYQQLCCSLFQVEKPPLNDDVELIRERLERCKSRAYKS
ncbi:unnamed protein product [Nesidiocoris tenuis]|uniref:TOG domain-containing protein n=1 Tax=Nesidiocoris tenuis TaxID=355587 RepID=A0A6H5GNQ6_9HEMI|nr:unnamed protein product [Nesidiocoris tenuis]